MASLFGLLERSAAAWPEAPALFEGDDQLANFAEMRERALSIAEALRSKGLSTGSRVAICRRNSADYIQTLWGIWAAAMVAVPINVRLNPHEVDRILSDSGAEICFVEADMSEALTSLLRERGAACTLWTTYVDTANAGDRDAATLPDSSDVAWLFYTSGTTGAPKGIMLSHANLFQMVNAYRAEVDSISPGDCQIHYAPLSHGSGMYMLAHVAAGAANVVATGGTLTFDDLSARISTHKGASIFCAPTMLKALCKSAATDSAIASGLKLIICGGAPTTARDYFEADRILAGRLAEIYGQGECPMTISRLTRDDIVRGVAGRDEAFLDSVGFPFAGIDVRIDVDGGDRAGEICVKGPPVMLGYWRDPSATATALVDGWLHSGDAGHFSADGMLVLTDRTKDIIISGGMNISPSEIEHVLAEHPDVAEVAAVGLPDPYWGEKVVACIVLRAGAKLCIEQLDQLCLEKMARFKRPKEYHVIDRIPLNATGKIVRNEIMKIINPN